jgi:predicted NAD/FAD-dependent oxidoreductase
MAKYDVVVIGAGAAGLSAAGLLAKEGKTVLLVERASYLGGRGMMVPDEEFRVQIGSHLVEDTGSGIMKIAEYLGSKIEIGPISSDMPVWDHNEERWGSIRDRYSGSNIGTTSRCAPGCISTPMTRVWSICSSISPCWSA